MAIKLALIETQALKWAVCLLLLQAFNVSTAEISSFQAGDGGWHLGTLAVGNLDSTPDREIVVPYRNSSGQWVIDAFKFNGQHLAGFPYFSGGEEMNTSPTLFDLDGDGRDEIFFTRGNHVIAMRGNGTILWSNTISSANYGPTCGYQVVTNGFYWSNGGGFMNHLPDTAVFSSQVSPPIVADLNGNGNFEVITGWKIKPDPVNGYQDYNPFINDIFGSGEWGTQGESWSGGVVFFNALTGAKQTVYHISMLVESGLAVGRAAWNGALHTYVLNDSDSVVAFDKSQPYGFWGKGMLHKQFGKNQRLMSGAYQTAIETYTADLDGDGLDEVLVAGTQWGTGWQPNETILDDDGGVLWRNWLPMTNFVHNYGWLNCASLIPVNPDHDNHVDVVGFYHGFEISYRYWNGIELVNHAGWPKNFYPYVPTPPVIGDVDGDGLEEIVIGTYHPGKNPSDGNLFIYALDGTLKTSVSVTGGLKHIPTLADVDNNGSLDIVYRSLLGRVHVQNFGANSAQRVSWGTHRGNAHRDGNRSLSLFPRGTPFVTQKISGYRRAAMTWTPMSDANGYSIRRAEKPEGPFAPLVTLPANANSYMDTGLKSGWQYFYEVGALYSTNTVYSSPVAILSFVNSNLVANGGFEENENSHWDKWFTGEIEMTNMVASTNVAWQGRRSMQIKMYDKGNNGSIDQYCTYGIPDSSIPVTPGQFYSFGCFFKTDGITRPSEHWLEWGSGKTAADTNNRPSYPYPNYFTPHFIPGTSPTGWMYANRAFILPAGFPNIDLRHRYTTASTCSGSLYIDNVFFRPLPAPGSSLWTKLLPWMAEWRYFTNTPPSDWMAKGFNDSAWMLGLAKFGAGSGPKNVITQLPQWKPAYYFRKEFVVTNPDIEELLLSATCTDDYGGTLLPLQIFINGTELVTTGIETVTGQGNEPRYFDLLPFANLLVAGTNTIAIKMGNLSQSTWDDVAFDVCIQAVPSRYSGANLTVTRSGSSMTLSAQGPVGTTWKMQSCNCFTSPWETIASFTNTSGAYQYIDNRPAPANGARFYRLTPF